MEVCRKHGMSEKCLEIWTELDEINKYFPESVEVMQRSGTFGMDSRNPEFLRNRLLGIKGIDDLVDLVQPDVVKKTQQS